MGYADLPKVLVPLANKPIIFRLLEEIQKLNLSTKPVVVVGHKYQLVQAMLGDKFIYAFQEGQLGTAHAVSAAKTKAEGQSILVLYGDMPFIKSESLNQLIGLHEKSSSKFSMLTTLVPNFENEYASFQGFGRIIRDQSGQLLQIREFVDASGEEKQITEVNPGIYLFDSKWLWGHIDSVLKNKHGEYYLTDLVEIAIKGGESILTASIDPLEVFGINTPAQLKQAESLIR